MDNYQNSEVKNRILEIPSFIPKSIENSLQTNEDSVYMEVDGSVILKLIETGILIADSNRSNCWSRGSKSKTFYDKRKMIIEAEYKTVERKEFKDISIQDLDAIWIYKENKYVNGLEYIQGAYMCHQNNKERNHR
jgi:hypothetical protein